MKIELASDLHLECGPIKMPGGDLLILAGDVCEIRSHTRAFHNTRLVGPPADDILRFFETECAKYQQVLYVLGNHEYYDGIYDQDVAPFAKNLPDNVKILNRDVYDAGDILCVGATLWTDCNKGDWHTKYQLQRCMTDFRLIRTNDGTRFLPDDAIQAHEQDLAYIKHIVEQNAQREIFVITHHTPSWASRAAKYINDTLMNGGYHTELGEFILDRENIKYWAHGHTHDPFDYMIGQCRVICHPRGYHPGEQSLGYAPKTVID